MLAHGPGVLGIMLGTSVLALSYNMVHSHMIQRTSAVATTVLGQVKIIALLLASVFLLSMAPPFHCLYSLGVRVQSLLALCGHA